MIPRHRFLFAICALKNVAGTKWRLRAGCARQCVHVVHSGLISEDDVSIASANLHRSVRPVVRSSGGCGLPNLAAQLQALAHVELGVDSGIEGGGSGGVRRG